MPKGITRIFYMENLAHVIRFLSDTKGKFEIKWKVPNKYLVATLDV
jgi:hypothetical protein